MAENSKIEWCDHTFNPWRGCTKVSEGCAHCYAETLSKRNPAVLGEWGHGKPRVKASPPMWQQPLKWNRDGRLSLRPRVFCASLADWLDEEVPIEWLAEFLELIRRGGAGVPSPKAWPKRPTRNRGPQPSAAWP